MQLLTQRDCMTYYSPALFNHYYRKHGGPNGNPFTVGTGAADFIIFNAGRP